MAVRKQTGCLVLLNGYPGVGKLSVARTLRSKIQDVLTSPTRLIDNHLIIDPAQAVHPGRGPEHKAFRTRLRHAILDELKTLPDPDTILIMTLSLKTDKEEIEVFAEHVDVGPALSRIQKMYKPVAKIS